LKLTSRAIGCSPRADPAHVAEVFRRPPAGARRLGGLRRWRQAVPAPALRCCPGMCGSKEAWEHFVFVPERPPRRLSRVAKHGAFLEGSRPIIMAAPGKALAIARKRRSPEDSEQHPGRCSVLARCAKGRGGSSGSLTSTMVSAGSVVGAAAAASALVGAAMAPAAGPAAALLKLGMMAPPPLAPPGMPGVSARPDTSSEGGRNDGILDVLFPNFDTDTFVWRISMLQITNYMASLMLGSSMGAPKLCSLYLLGASWGPAIAGGAVWRLFLPMLLHANALHIFFNIFFQLRIGFGMEKQFGRRKFCLMYLFCGFLGNLLSVVANPFKLAVGASTSGFGLLGVWAAEVLLTWELLGTSRSRLLMWFAFMLSSCVMMSTLSPSVDFMGHFGGALAGFLLAIILADMQEEHRPSWYGRAKASAKSTAAILILAGLLKAITLGPDGPVPFCGSLFSPRVLPF